MKISTYLQGLGFDHDCVQQQKKQTQVASSSTRWSNRFSVVKDHFAYDSCCAPCKGHQWIQLGCQQFQRPKGQQGMWLKPKKNMANNFLALFPYFFTYIICIIYFAKKDYLERNNYLSTMLTIIFRMGSQKKWQFKFKERNILFEWFENVQTLPFIHLKINFLGKNNISPLYNMSYNVVFFKASALFLGLPNPSSPKKKKNRERWDNKNLF